MQKLLTGCGLVFALWLLSGCAMTTPGLGEEAGNTTLPRGSTLLDSDEEECDATVQVSEEIVGDEENEGLEAALFVEPGENATFELQDDEEVEWACVGGESPEVDSMSCPVGATHVRITRASQGGEVLVECYG